MDVTNSPDVERMKQFIFGELSGEESETIEEKLFLDDKFFFEMTALENDLVDRYVSGLLESGEAERFKRALAGSGELREQVRNAKALKQVITGGKGLDAPSPAPQTEKISWWGSLTAFFDLRLPVMQYAAAGLIILMTAGLIGLFYDGYRLRQQIAQERESTLSRENELKKLREDIGATEGRIKDLQTRLAEQSGTNEELTKELEDRQAELDALRRRELETGAEQFYLAKVTSADGTRGDVNVESTIKRSAKFVSIRLPISTESRYDHYEIDIKGNRNTIRIDPSKCSGGKCWVTLPAGNLEFSVTGVVEETGTRNKIGDFKLTLEKKK